MICRIETAIYEGILGKRIWIESDISNGLPSFNIVGLAGTSVKESHERVKLAIINSGFPYPRGRITINLFPANINKRGSHMDLPIAISLLSAEGAIDIKNLTDFAIFGELSLDGTVLPICGILPMIYGLSKKSVKKVIIPSENIEEAMLKDDIEIIPVSSLKECIDYLNGKPTAKSLYKKDIKDEDSIDTIETLDFKDVNGQIAAKRSACISAAGGHGLIMIGPPGCGKTMIARRIPSILPKMNIDEIIETTMIYSVAGKLNEDKKIIKERPFRMPYQGITTAGLIGGGLFPVPGEISLAHNGVLFLDEFCEFDRKVIEKIRKPIEDHEVILNRRGRIYSFPARSTLIMATNPCPCGYMGDSKHRCKCSTSEIERYRKKLSGPILDRIDLQIYMERVEFNELTVRERHSMGSFEMKEVVLRAREFARKRNQNTNNASLKNEEILKYCDFDKEEYEFIKKAYESFSLSPRSLMKILKVARTIADIEESKKVKIEHISEALNYRITSKAFA